MDRTANRGYTYPQCLPPLVKDASNAPVNTRQLAEEIDADLDTVSVQVEDTYQLPTAILRISAATSIGSGSDVPFDVVEYNPHGWDALPGITVVDAGIYLVTGFVHSVAATNVQSLAVQFTGNGSPFYLQGTSPPASGFGRMTGSGVTLVNAGSVLGMRVLYSGTDPSNFDNCWFSVTRLVAT